MFSGKSRTKGTDGQQSIILPCKVYSPDAYVTLSKEILLTNGNTSKVSNSSVIVRINILN